MIFVQPLLLHHFSISRSLWPVDLSDKILNENHQIAEKNVNKRCVNFLPFFLKNHMIFFFNFTKNILSYFFCRKNKKKVLEVLTALVPTMILTLKVMEKGDIWKNTRKKLRWLLGDVFRSQIREISRKKNYIYLSTHIMFVIYHTHTQSLYILKKSVK